MSSAENFSFGKQKKLNRKLAKLRHVLKKETGTLSSSIPTQNLAICNAGIVSGLTEEIIFEYFSKYGTLTDITLLPGKSCCFVSYDCIQSAVKAYNTLNGKLNIAQENKPIYLLYVDRIVIPRDQKVWGELPPGLVLIDNFIDTCEEEILMQLCNFEDAVSGALKHRLVRHFGFEFRYDVNNVDKDKPLSDLIPSETNFLWPRLQETVPEFITFKPDQLTINHYLPGQGIPHHIDTHSAFDDPIICLSLGSPIVMEFKKEDKHTCILLPQRSLLIMSEESRYNWSHGIVPRKFDVVNNESGVGFTCLKRGTRVSFTFRKVLQGNCICPYKTKCDSFKEDIQMKDNIASQLEALHVHQVYENIADHFSDTRHKPWPNVLEFVQSFGFGDILVDIGCGNGKYLANNSRVYDIGCDRSAGLVDICRERNFEAFIGDCLSIALKDGIADGVISIAVIHHLANEHRRIKAIKEIVRILKVGGRALLYVWAHDQVKNQKKSSYIMQDRKNRKQASEDMHSLTTDLCDRDIIDALVILPGGTEVVICSAYFPGSALGQPPPQMVQKVIAHCKKNDAQLVIGCDANAHHTVWGSTDINHRGSKDIPLLGGNVALQVHTNRSNFQAKDLLVPWKLKDENKTTFLRFYHVFEENELERLCQRIENIDIIKSYYDQGNWCVLFRKCK